jgi:hypothetical protein
MRKDVVCTNNVEYDGSLSYQAQPLNSSVSLLESFAVHQTVYEAIADQLIRTCYEFAGRRCMIILTVTSDKDYPRPNFQRPGSVLSRHERNITALEDLDVIADGSSFGANTHVPGAGQKEAPGSRGGF